jgi:hypothetical protein
MPNLTDYSENLLLTWLMTANAATRPTAWFVGVGTGHTDTGLTGEPSGNGYARQALTSTVTGSTAASNAALLFGPATASWGTMASVGIFDAASGGNALWTGSLQTARTIDNGDTLSIAAAALTETMS